MDVQVTKEQQLSKAFKAVEKQVAVTVKAIKMACDAIDYRCEFNALTDVLNEINNNKVSLRLNILQLEKQLYAIAQEVKTTILNANVSLQEKNTILAVLLTESRGCQEKIEAFKKHVIQKQCVSETGEEIPKRLERVSFQHVFDINALPSLKHYEVSEESYDYTMLKTRYITLHKQVGDAATQETYPVLFSLGNELSEIATAWDIAVNFFAKQAQHVHSIKLLHPFYLHIDYPDNHLIVYFNAVTGDRHIMTQIHKQYSDLVHSLIAEWRAAGVTGNYQLFDDGITTDHWELHAHLISDCGLDDSLVQNQLSIDGQQAKLQELFNSLVFSLDHELLPVIAEGSNEVRNPFQYLHQTAIWGWRKLLSSLVTQTCVQPQLALMLLSTSIQETMSYVARGLAISQSNKEALLTVLQQDFVRIKDLLDTFNQSENKRLRVKAQKTQRLSPAYQPVMCQQTAEGIC